MRDTIETIGKGSVIQHGKHNDRIYLMKLALPDAETILPALSKLARKNKYAKIFCKIPKHIAPLFFADGYILEAYIPRFYNNNIDVFFVSKFLNSDRLLHIEVTKLSALHHLITAQPPKKENQENATAGYSIKRLHKTDVQHITEIYRDIFKSYPFPIHNPGYILKTMDNNVQYYGAEKEGNIGALASSEIDVDGKNAELTDFATSSMHQGQGLAGLLLRTMEDEMKKQGISTVYTIARVNSVPMNKTFLRSGFHYSGTLIKNTNIAGEIESMNVFYKHV